MELLLTVILLAGAMVPVAWRARRRGVWLGGMAVIVAGAGVLAAMGLTPAPGSEPTVRAQPVSVLPRLGLPDDAFVTSDTCRSCHPGEHHSWHRSYHRTMTQIAGPDTVLGDFSRPSIVIHGREYRVWREGDRFMVNLLDPDKEQDFHDARQRGVDTTEAEEAHRVTRPIVMTTGSQHYQSYWIPGVRGNELEVFPLIYQLDEKRWMTRESAFLMPATDLLRANWNNVCIDCHAVAGQATYDAETDTFETRVAELGITCEACHGPAEEHIRFHSDPRHRYTARRTGEPDPTIVNPANLDHRRASHVCAQCHGLAILDEEGGDNLGTSFRAGDDIDQNRFMVLPARKELDPHREQWRRQHEILARSQSRMDSWFWRDGELRVSGREYNGMAESACFTQGALSCLSCHSLHGYEQRADQLAPGMRGDQACLQCHDDYADRIEAHTHHPAGSSGAACYACHMPHTSYGLLKGIRTHLIASPSVTETTDVGRINACNQCHIDQTLAWTQQHLVDWYGHEPAPLSWEQANISTTLLMLLSGDAGQRAPAAWALGEADMHEAGGRTWIAPLLAPLLNDPYEAVRYITGRTLRRLPGFADFEYDFLTDEDARRDAVRRAAHVWHEQVDTRRDMTGDRLLIDADGSVQIRRLDALLRRRNDRPMTLAE